MSGKRVRISPGFLLMISLFLFLDESGVALCILAACALHEGGHLIVLRAVGGRVKEFDLTLNGARIQTERGRGLSYEGELLAVLAGPGVNLILAVACAGLGEKCYLFSGVNLALGIFNLLPLPGLDGGRTLRLLALLLKEEEKKRRKE